MNAQRYKELGQPIVAALKAWPRSLQALACFYTSGDWRGVPDAQPLPRTEEHDSTHAEPIVLEEEPRR